MAASARITVGTTPTALNIPSEAGANRSLLIRNRGTAEVFLGGAAVTATDGFQVDAGESVTVDTVDAADAIYGIAATGTVVCHVLAVAS